MHVDPLSGSTNGNMLCFFHSPLQCATLAKGLSERVQSRGEFMREVSLLNEGEFKGFFDREMHALLLLSLRSLPPEFKMSLSASLSATSLIGIGQAPSLIARSCFFRGKWGLFGVFNITNNSLLETFPILPISRSSCPFSSSTGSLVVVLSEQTRFRSQYSIFPH